MAAEPQVPADVDARLVRPFVLAPVELHRQPERGPQAVDLPRADPDVAVGKRDAVLDEQAPEPALEAALHLAPSGNVVLESGPQPRAAGVAPAQRAQDVLGADVVTELRLRERSLGGRCGSGAQPGRAASAGRWSSGTARSRRRPRGAAARRRPASRRAAAYGDGRPRSRCEPAARGRAATSMRRYRPRAPRRIRPPRARRRAAPPRRAARAA